MAVAATLARTPAPRPAPSPRLAPSASPAPRSSDMLSRQALSGAPTIRLTRGRPSLAPISVPGLSGGVPLPPQVQGSLEASLGMDLSAIRVHTGDPVLEMAAGPGARAFTVGNHIVLGRGVSPTDLRVMAHEVAHVVQQQGVPTVQAFTTSGSADAFEREAEHTAAAVQHGESATIQQQTGGLRVQGFLGIDIPNPLDWLAGKANIIPGFRMFTIILGVNPINMSRVDRSAANILRALIEFMPGGGLITQALENSGIFDKAGAWVQQQVDALGMAGSAIKKAVDEFIGSLSLPGDLLRPIATWERAKNIFTGPIDRLKKFAGDVVSGIIDLVKAAILRPLAALAEGTEAYDLLKAVLGEDPITGDKVPRNADTLIGGFMKLIGQQEVWENIKKGNAIARAWAWFQGALEGLMGFVRSIPRTIVDMLTSLTISDIITVVGAFTKVGRAFLNVAGSFLNWAVNQVISLLEILFSVVAPGAVQYVAKAKAAFHTIIRNPVGFIGNLVRAGKMGFELFAGNFIEHLKAALIKWITGPLGQAGVYIPTSFSLMEIVKLVLSVLGLTWQNIRSKLLKIIPEPVLVVVEKTAVILVTLIKDGPAAAWEQIKGELSELKDQLIAQVTQMITVEVAKAAVIKLVSMLNPAGAVIQAILAIYNTVTFFVEKLKQIGEVVAAFIDSISAIAAGQVANAAKKVELTMANMLTMVITFLAKFVGLGNVPDKVVGVIKKIRQPIDRGLDKIVGWLGGLLKKLVGAVKAGVKALLQWWKKKAPFTGEARLTLCSSKAMVKMLN